MGRNRHFCLLWLSLFSKEENLGIFPLACAFLRSALARGGQFVALERALGHQWDLGWVGQRGSEKVKGEGDCKSASGRREARKSGSEGSEEGYLPDICRKKSDKKSLVLSATILASAGSLFTASTL